MNLLALETATEACSVALLRITADGRREVVARRRHAPRQQTELILPMVDEVLAEAGLTLRALDALAYSRGPGAFTGVRIAAAVTQGLALGADLAVIPVSSLQALAQGAARLRDADAVLASFDARMQEIYAGAFAADAQGLMQPLADEVACRPEAIPETLRAAWANATGSDSLGAGSGWATYGDRLALMLPVSAQAGDLEPDAEDVATLAVPVLQAGGAVAPEFALPVYLRDDVWKKLPGR